MSKTTQDGAEWKLSPGQAHSRAKLPTTQSSKGGKALLCPIWAAFVGGPEPATCISEPQFPCCLVSLNPKVLRVSSSLNTLTSLIQPNPSPGFSSPKSKVTGKVGEGTNGLRKDLGASGGSNGQTFGGLSPSPPHLPGFGDSKILEDSGKGAPS